MPRKIKTMRKPMETQQSGFISAQTLMMAALMMMVALTMFTAASVSQRVKMVHTHDLWTQTVKVTRNTIHSRIAEQSNLPASNGQWIKTYKIC